MKQVALLIRPRRIIYFEKHFQSPLPHSFLDPYFSTSSTAVNDILQIQDSLHGARIQRQELFVIALFREDSPLFMIEFLHMLVDLIELYVLRFNEDAVVDNIVLLHLLLGEIIKDGVPFFTEPNVLRELVHSPSLINSVMQAVVGSSSYVHGSIHNIFRRTNFMIMDFAYFYFTRVVHVNLAVL